MTGLLNGISQVFSVTWFNLRTLPQRIGSSATAVYGIAGVVAVMVGVLSIAEGIQPTIERFNGYQSALEAANLVPDPDLVGEGDFSRLKAYEVTETMLDLPDPPTAIFASNSCLVVL